MDRAKRKSRSDITVAAHLSLLVNRARRHIVIYLQTISPELKKNVRVFAGTRTISIFQPLKRLENYDGEEEEIAPCNKSALLNTVEPFAYLIRVLTLFAQTLGAAA